MAALVRNLRAQLVAANLLPEKGVLLVNDHSCAPTTHTFFIRCVAFPTQGPVKHVLIALTHRPESYTLREIIGALGREYWDNIPIDCSPCTSTFPCFQTHEGAAFAVVQSCAHDERVLENAVEDTLENASLFSLGMRENIGNPVLGNVLVLQHRIYGALGQQTQSTDRAQALDITENDYLDVFKGMLDTPTTSPTPTKALKLSSTQHAPHKLPALLEPTTGAPFASNEQTARTFHVQGREREQRRATLERSASSSPMRTGSSQSQRTPPAGNSTASFGEMAVDVASPSFGSSGGVQDIGERRVSPFSSFQLYLERELIRWTDGTLIVSRWQAPELMLGSDNDLTPEMDVYAYSICCIEILVIGRLPWPLMNDDVVRNLVLSVFSPVPWFAHSGLMRGFAEDKKLLQIPCNALHHPCARGSS
uniref:Serine-threonine/tyrosine-protein kinase catalytic domain-containing protein n=1 Tax=Mycena chlorophos TaxID=658473 RepID=A0ABQ0KZT9_MYCCL|nr:predicted protein [Mycena chlorophos]